MGIFGSGGLWAHTKKLLNPRSIPAAAKGYVSGLATTGNPYAAIGFAAKSHHDWAVDQQDKDRGLGQYATGDPAAMNASREEREKMLDELTGGLGGKTPGEVRAHSPYAQKYTGGAGMNGMYGSDAGTGNLGMAGRRPGPYEGSYFQEGDEEGMFHNEDGGHDWAVGTGPQFLRQSPQTLRTGRRPVGPEPPQADQVDPGRKSLAWRMAEEKHQAWIKQNLDAGRTLADLGQDPTRGGGLSNYMKWGSYKPDPAAAGKQPINDPGSGIWDPYNPGGPGEGGGAEGPGGPGGPGGPYNGPGGPGPSNGSGMYDYQGPESVWGDSETGGDYGLARMYQGLLGNSAQSGAFLAPQTQALQEQKDGQIKTIMATIPPGGQRDRALANLDKSFNSSLSQMRQGLLQGSMSGLQNLYGTQLGDATQRYGIDTQADTSRYATDVGADTSRYGIDMQTGLGYANLGQRGYEFDTGMDWDQNKFGQQFGLEKAKYLTDSDQWEKLFGRQDLWRKDDQSKDKWAGVGNTISGLAQAYLANRGTGMGSPKQNRVKFTTPTDAEQVGKW